MPSPPASSATLVQRATLAARVPGMRTWRVTSFELGTDGPTRILVGVDGSDTSMRAGAYAAGLARRQGSQLMVALRRADRRHGGGHGRDGRRAHAGARPDRAPSSRTRSARPCSALGVPIKFVRRRGNPYVELVRIADSCGWTRSWSGPRCSPATASSVRSPGGLSATRSGRSPSSPERRRKKRSRLATNPRL